ncbi:hypothetical protein C9374_012601 [Naegleria lovaniensis]|uniref:Coiled-coil domain-containing protein n=1 Tax=Naegleria lovaniensis TaxID=51637 RepID=A0AA88KR41_NAELO|nr:uncharacterized protein C9374_012601 [Naegleria lovaniensis]KAG2392349.1 hypothetical protein C9374_012601 [Naegleria lovaniensis]
MARPRSDSLRGISKKTSELGTLSNIPFTRGLNTAMMKSHFCSQTESQKELLEKYKDDSKALKEKCSLLNHKVSSKRKQIKTQTQNIEWANEWKRLRKIQLDLEKDLEEDRECQIERSEYRNNLFRQLQECINSPLKSVKDCTYHFLKERILETSQSITSVEHEIMDLYKDFEKLNPLTVDETIDNNTFSMEDVIQNYLTRASGNSKYNHIDPVLDQLLKELKLKLQLIIEEYRKGKLIPSSHKWNKDDHQRFKTVFKQYNTPGMTIEKARSYYEALKLVLPYKTESELKEHDKWYKTIHLIEIQKMKENKAKLLNELKKLENFAVEAISIHLSIMQAKSREEEEKQQFSQLAEKTRKLLQEQTAINEEKMKQDIERLAQEEKQRKREEELDRQKETKRRDLLRQQLSQYFAEKEEAVRKQEEERKREEDALQEQYRIMQKRNKDRVDFRKNKDIEKIEQRKAMIIQRQEEEKKREQYLNNLIQGVYEELRLLDIETDAKRLTQPTQSLLNKQKDEEETEQFSSAKIYGYTNEDLMRDKKFKLQLLLQEAGLLHTGYAKEVFSTMKPSRQTRIDNLTSEQSHLLGAFRNARDQ